MKKKKLAFNLLLNKKVISNLNTAESISKLNNEKLFGGGLEISERRTNCELCPPPPSNNCSDECYTNAGLSCWLGCGGGGGGTWPV